MSFFGWTVRETTCSIVECALSKTRVLFFCNFCKSTKRSGKRLQVDLKSCKYTLQLWSARKDGS